MSKLTDDLRNAEGNALVNFGLAPVSRRSMYKEFAELFAKAAARIEELEKPEEKTGEVFTK